MWLLLAFILVPLIEIGLFIQVGGWLGLWPTLAIVLLTAIAGTYLVRTQGMSVLADVQRSMNQFSDPTSPLAHGAMILFSGALLLTPGFFTDAVGFLLLVPPVRESLISYAKSRISAKSAQFQQQSNQDQTVVDAEYHEVPPHEGPSPWTKD